MLLRPFGRTGKSVSAIGCGGMRFPEDEGVDACADIAVRANDAGVNYFDTAPLYGRSEEILGRAFRRMRNPWYVSTKSLAKDGQTLRQDLETSLRRLGVDRIHFFHIWCVMSMEMFEQRLAGGVIDAARKAMDEGLIEHLCLSTHQPGREIADMVRLGIFEGVTLGYNVLNFPFREHGVRAAAAGGLGVVTMNPLGGGLLPRHRERFRFLDGLGGSAVDAALRFNLSHPEIACALVGFSSVSQVDDAVRAVDRFRPFTPAELEDLEDRIPDAFDAVCTTCGYCLPCPEDVPIPKLMDAFNLSVLDGETENVLRRMKGHWGIDPEAADRCTECGECEVRCTQNLPIRERIARIREFARERTPQE